MSFFVDQADATTALQERGSQGSRTGFGENFSAAYDATIKSGLSSSERWNERDAYEAVVEALNADIPKGAEFNDQRFIEPKQWMLENDLAMQTGRKHERWRSKEDLENAIWDEIARRREVDPSALGDLPGSAKEMREQIYAQVQEAERHAEKVSATSNGLGVAGQFAGNMAGVIQDPPIAASAMIPVGTGLSIGRTILLEGVIGATSEAMVQPTIQDYREEAGLERGNILENIATAGAASAAFGGLFKGAGRVYGRLRGAPTRLSDADLLKKFDELNKKPNAEQRAAKSAIEAELNLSKDNPLDGRAGKSEHRARVDQATQAAEEGVTPPMDPRPSAPMRVRTGDDIDNLDGLVYAFKPDELEVDAKLFQFKEGGDASGVTDRLLGVQHWDPVKAGQVLVYEFEGGRRFIADGHQRHGLAKRIAAQNDGQHVRLIGQVIRESDGISPEMARVIAAMKNVAEGTGTAIDAAKVLRVDPDRLSELPPRSQLVRQAQDLVNLSDEGFGLVVNEIVPAHVAAVVGRLIPDDLKLQSAALDVLVKADPENVTQAEAIVRQVKEVGTVDEKQIGLFGEELITKSLIVERAKILDRTMKRLRKDKGVFKSLVDNSGHIAKAGNRLADAENLKRVTTDEQALQTLQRLANRKGPLSDELELAAMEAVEGRGWNHAVDQFVASVRTAIARGDFDGSTIGRGGRAVDAETQISRSPEQEQAELIGFVDPAGEAAQKQADALERTMHDVFEREMPVNVGHALDVDEAGLAKLRQDVADLVKVTRTSADNKKVSVDLGQVTDETAEEINQLLAAGGDAVDVHGYHHEIDNYAIKHAIKQHGDPDVEAKRGQVGLMDEDLAQIPDVLAEYDRIEYVGKTRQGRDGIGYWKAIDDGTLFYVEEVRTKRGKLSTVSMRKYRGKGGAGSQRRPDASKSPQSHAQDALRESQPSQTIVADLSDDVEVPVGLEALDDGGVAARTRPLREIMDELDAESSFLDDLEGGCLK